MKALGQEVGHSVQVEVDNDAFLDILGQGFRQSVQVGINDRVTNAACDKRT